jgi:F-box-like
VTANALPDEILLKIFDFCRVAATTKVPLLWPGLWTETWHNLVHVCKRWRYVVFSSPLGLDLRLSCTDSTSVKKMLDVWPPFPIEIRSFHLGDNVIAALEHHDRVCNLDLYPSSHSKFERLVTVMANPFPTLIQLRLSRQGKFD